MKTLWFGSEFCVFSIYDFRRIHPGEQLQGMWIVLFFPFESTGKYVRKLTQTQTQGLTQTLHFNFSYKSEEIYKNSYTVHFLFS